MELDGLFAEVRAVLQQAPSVVTFDALTVVLGDGDAPVFGERARIELRGM